MIFAEVIFARNVWGVMFHFKRILFDDFYITESAWLLFSFFLG